MSYFTGKMFILKSIFIVKNFNFNWWDVASKEGVIKAGDGDDGDRW